MKKLFVLFLFCLTSLAAAQSVSPIMENVKGREHTSLAGSWNYIVDIYEVGFYNYRWQEERNGFGKDAKQANKSQLIEYSFDDSPLMFVPGDWHSQEEKLFYYEGTVWFKRGFDYQLKPGNRLFVYFGAANYEAITYLNGKKLGRHEGGFTPFQYEITDLVKETGNSLVVKVDNKRKPDGVPGLNTDWFNFGGITRDVLLVEVPGSFISDYKFQLKKDSMDTIAGFVQLDGPAKEQEVMITVADANISQKVKTDASGYAAFELSAGGIALWSPEKPVLHDVVFSSSTDKVSDRIGLRCIQVRGDEILLNGKSIFMRGVCIHEQAPFHDGRATSPEQAYTKLKWAKEMNCNFVRLAHYPHNEHTVRLADELGLLVWAENPVYWTINWSNTDTYKLAQKQLTEMICRDKNRAAVVIWSMSNETPVTEARLKFQIGLATTARELDNTRLISSALEKHYEGDKTVVIQDPFGDHLDVIGVNEYIGWYDGRATKADGVSWKMAYNKPLIMSEFGAGCKYGYHGDKDTIWTEEFQEDIFIHTIGMFKRIPFLRGTSPWILTDFQSPRRLLPGIQDGWNRKGLISDKGQKKKAFYIMQGFYAEKQAQAGK